MWGGRFASVVVLVALIASCDGTHTKTGGKKATTVGTSAPACLVHSPTTSTTADLGYTSFTFSDTGGTPVPTTVVKPHCLPVGPVVHALQLAEAINASSLGCETASLDSSVIKTPPTSASPKEQVSCDIGDDSITISLWADHNGLARAIPYVRQGHCYVETHNPSNQGRTYVEGDNWIVYPQYTATAHRLGTALRATEQTIHC
jgi:hypothetical protein